MEVAIRVSSNALIGNRRNEPAWFSFPYSRFPLHTAGMLTFNGLDGALLIDKPAGPTSHDVVEHLRHHLSIKKVGHTGTLDPDRKSVV